MPATDSPTPVSLWPPEFVRDIPHFGGHHLLDSFSLSRAVSAFLKETPVEAVLSWQYETSYLSTFTQSSDFVLGVIAAAPFGFLKKKAESSLPRRIAYHLFHFRQLRQADVVYVASQFARDELLQHIGLAPEKIVVIPIGVEAVFQSASALRTGPIRKFIFSGSLEPIKGIFDVLEALAILNRLGYSDWSLKICGWGNELAVRKLASQYEISNHIEFAGPLDHPTLAAELAQADLAILPSHTETFGLSIAEAQACGLPVVSYRVGGIPEVVIEGETASLVNLWDTAALAEAILHLIQNPETARKMGQRGAQLMRENFSWQKTTKLMLDNLSSLIAR